MCPPSSDDSSDGFFARWSRRKVQAKATVPAPPTGPAPAQVPAPSAVTARQPEPATQAPGRAFNPAPNAARSLPSGESPQLGRVDPAAGGNTRPAAPPAPPPPTLEDLARIDALDARADFSRFVQPNVSSELKNAALKKLFTDPHFNVMDGLDTYIDDYGLPDPLPPGMLEQLQLGDYLGLREPAQELPPDSPAPASTASPEPALTPPTPDENADLRLQPHDAAGRPRPEPGAGPDAGGLG